MHVKSESAIEIALKDINRFRVIHSRSIKIIEFNIHLKSIYNKSVLVDHLFSDDNALNSLDSALAH